MAKTKDSEALFLYDPMVVPSGLTMWQHYPIFKKNGWFCDVPTEAMLGGQGDNKYAGMTIEDADTLLRFVVLMVDYRSELAQELDIEEKKRSIARLLKIDLKGSRIGKEILKTGNWIQKVIAEYFKLIHSIEYESWITLKMSYHNVGEFLRRPIDANVTESNINARRQLQKEYPGMQKSLIDMEYQLFRDESLRDIMNREESANDLGSWAEKFAED